MGYADLLRKHGVPNHLHEGWITKLLSAQDIHGYALTCHSIGWRLKREFEDKVKQILQDEEQAARATAAVVHVGCDAELPHRAVLHDTEVAALASITAALKADQHDVQAVLITSRVHAGCRFLLQHLHANAAFRTLYPGGVWHVRADLLEGTEEAGEAVAPPRASDLEAALRRIYDDYSKPGDLNLHALLNFLERKRQLLVVHNLSALSAQGGRAHPALALIEDFAALVRRKVCAPNPAPLLVTEWHSTVRLNTEHFEGHELKVKISSDDARAYFWKMFDHYQTRRSPDNQELLSNDWPRRKRIEWHYREIGKQSDPETGGPRRRTVTPASVRFRAICLSNAKNFSCHDATQGFDRLIGSDLLNGVPEVETIKEDIIGFMHSGALSASDRDALRLVSTGVYFFTEAMLDRLKDANVGGSQLGQIRLSDRLPFVSYMSERDNAFVLSLMVRAAVQDDWIHSGCATRSEWHAAVASQLHVMSASAKPPALGHTDPLLEFPFSPPWDDARILFAAEAVRHYVRAAQSQPGEAPNHFASAYGVYVDLGETFDPHRPRQNGQKSEKSLSRATGQYRLKLELMGLLSEDGDAEEPAARLNLEPIRAAVYHYEVGTTHALLLNLQPAQDAFAQGLSAVGDDPSPQSARARLLLRSQQIMAYLEAGQIQNAFGVQRLLRDDFRRLEEGEIRAKERARRVARLAAISAAQGRRARSLRLFRSLYVPGDGAPLHGERALWLINVLIEPEIRQTPNGDILMSHPDAEDMTEAWVLCEQLQSLSRDEGYKFQNLAFETRRARIVRRFSGKRSAPHASEGGAPRVGEAILERVGLLLGRFGGSEKEFKEFQIESAATLISLDRPRYALAAYALPAWDQLKQTSAELLKKRLQTVMRRARDAIAASSEDRAVAEGEHDYRARYELMSNGLDPFNSLPLLPTAEEFDHYQEEIE
ncbi:MAG: hypothetical protein AAGB05_11655 [Pseudomonadota bacterium]